MQGLDIVLMRTNIRKYTNLWRIINHELEIFDDQHLLRSYRSISNKKVTALKAMIDVGIRSIEAFVYLAKEVDIVENISLSK